MNLHIYIHICIYIYRYMYMYIHGTSYIHNVQFFYTYMHTYIYIESHMPGMLFSKNPSLFHSDYQRELEDLASMIRSVPSVPVPLDSQLPPRLLRVAKN